MIKKGQIVLVPFPFTDLSGLKVRPALIVSKKIVGSDVVVLFISSKPNKKKMADDVLIKQSKENGLKANSLVKCSKLATLDKKVVLGEIGKLSKSDQKKVDTKLKQILF